MKPIVIPFKSWEKPFKPSGVSLPTARIAPKRSLGSLITSYLSRFNSGDFYLFSQVLSGLVKLEFDNGGISEEEYHLFESVKNTVYKNFELTNKNNICHHCGSIFMSLSSCEFSKDYIFVTLESAYQNALKIDMNFGCIFLNELERGLRIMPIKPNNKNYAERWIKLKRSSMKSDVAISYEAISSQEDPNNYPFTMMDIDKIAFGIGLISSDGIYCGKPGLALSSMAGFYNTLRDKKIIKRKGWSLEKLRNYFGIRYHKAVKGTVNRSSDVFKEFEEFTEKAIENFGRE
ncbi:hypothetical protein [Hymenobacter rigui]|uniref:hypothetical protein n=1 Tax=Hymenobacter rigui TaxID=334424 RepID=UPI0011D01473|nr:hypothetical protein [Hymenobacter rigui]